VVPVLVRRLESYRHWLEAELWREGVFGGTLRIGVVFPAGVHEPRSGVACSSRVGRVGGGSGVWAEF